MAIMKLTAFNAGLKGKLSGTIFQHGKFGQVCLTKAQLIDAVASSSKLTKADAGKVIPIHRYLTAISSAWRALSTAQRATWIAGAINFPFNNKFGDAYTPSGFQVYMSLNLALLASGQTVLTLCPTKVAVVNAPSYDVTQGTTAGRLALENLTPVAGWTWTLYAATSISKGRQPSAGIFKAIYVSDNSETFPFDIAGAYEGLLGTLPTHGNLWFRLEFTNNTTGQKGNPYYFNLAY